MKKLKNISIILLFLSSIALIYFFRYINEYEALITHILYIPVILVAFWWRYRVIYAIVIISIMLGLSDYMSGVQSFVVHDLLRITLLTFSGIFVASMKGYMLKFSSFKKYRDILFAVQEPMAIVDRGLAVFIQNKKFSEIFNIGKNGTILSLFNNIMQEQSLYDSLTVCFEGGETVYKGSFVTAKGDTRLFEVRCYPLQHDENNRFAIMNFRDVTRETEIALKQKRAFDLQRVVIDILELLNKKDYDLSVIDRILALITLQTGVEGMGLKLKSDSGYRLYSSAGLMVLREYLEGECGSECCDDSCFCLRRYCPAGCEGGEEQPPAEGSIWTNDPDDFVRLKNIRHCGCMDLYSIKSFAVIPVKSGEEAIGFFVLVDRRSSFLSDELMEFYEGIAESIGIALDRIEYEGNLKQIIEEKELLIREVHHRVKNNMQVITSLISLQASRQSDEHVRSILNECQNRVRTMALVHEKLYSSNNYTSINFGSYINTLIPMLMNSYRIEKELVKVNISSQDIQLDLNTAVPLAQLVNEILSNVFKHAFPSGRSGTVDISLSRNAEKARNCLYVMDTGTGLADGVTFPSRGNLGFQLIDALVRQIKGTIEFSGTGGVMIRIEF